MSANSPHCVLAVIGNTRSTSQPTLLRCVHVSGRLCFFIVAVCLAVTSCCLITVNVQCMHGPCLNRALCVSACASDLCLCFRITSFETCCDVCLGLVSLSSACGPIS